MAKVKDCGNGAFLFFCPGCGHDHVYYTGRSYIIRSRWEFNGDINNPTFYPSLSNKWGKEADPKWQEPEDIHTPPDKGWSGRCHLYVENGVINYCGDCSHDYNGKKGVVMKEYS